MTCRKRQINDKKRKIPFYINNSILKSLSFAKSGRFTFKPHIGSQSNLNRTAHIP